MVLGHDIWKLCKLPDSLDYFVQAIIKPLNNIVLVSPVTFVNDVNFVQTLVAMKLN